MRRLGTIVSQLTAARRAMQAASANDDGRLVPLHGFGTNSGELDAFVYSPTDTPTAAGRRPPRLHADRGRLRPRQRLVQFRRPARLRAPLPPAAPEQQRQFVLQLVRTRRCAARPGRGRLDRPDGRAHGRPVPAGRFPHLRHRPLGGRRDDVGDAGHLSGAVCRRRGDRRPAVRQRQQFARSPGADARPGLAAGRRPRRPGHRGGRPPPAAPTLSVWHGTSDKIVDPANAAALVDQWRAVHGLGARRRDRRDGRRPPARNVAR